MKKIIEKQYCTGCEACLNICPHNAIQMERDYEGFYYPQINQTLCIDCGLCEKTCPVLNYADLSPKRSKNNDIQKAFAAKIKYEKYRSISSSGGIFPAIANYILNQGGLIVGAAFDSKYNVYHKIISSPEELKEIQASKYAQSKIGLLYKEIKKYLQSGKIVFFTGMACQVEGLKLFLRKDYDNLYTADLICMGIPSPGVWRTYLDTIFEGEKIQHINFKDKTYGWRNFSLRIETNKRLFLEKGFDNAFFQCMFKTYTLRPSCFHCPFKKVERLSDFTLADCWGTIDEVPQLDDNKGLSAVVIHSSKGIHLWEKLSYTLDIAEVNLTSIIKHNDNLVKNKQSHHKRNDFYYYLNQKSPKKAFAKFGKNPNKSLFLILKKKIRTFIKVVLNK